MNSIARLWARPDLAHRWSVLQISGTLRDSAALPTFGERDNTALSFFEHDYPGTADPLTVLELDAGARLQMWDASRGVSGAEVWGSELVGKPIQQGTTGCLLRCFMRRHRELFAMISGERSGSPLGFGRDDG